MGNHSPIFYLNPFICMCPCKTCRFVLCAHKQWICTYFKFALLALCCRHYFVCPQTILKICLCYGVYILTSNCSIVFWREHLLHFIFLICWTPRLHSLFITDSIFSGYLLHLMHLKAQLHEANHSCMKMMYFLYCHAFAQTSDLLMTTHSSRVNSDSSISLMKVSAATSYLSYYILLMQHLLLSWWRRSWYVCLKVCFSLWIPWRQGQDLRGGIFVFFAVVWWNVYFCQAIKH